ncbi:3'-5' exonuclease [Hymenobacter cellulosilyticus]|uniref:3'-5' exonuclease n=1 Tax=Hymenobacter cellulosilyticus TaxID=2932248 RepID=A0A8T9QF44_9BACT|nr:3'-5' exonuclease [Hymenobacter cellulosilyticus]UOQ74189.1 3'-5' exonuclease [Hymenobacter cellulosilyticus]
MREYVLFVDTETSGIPQDWNQPYSVLGNWPHIAQLAWVIYTKDGAEIKAETHYILPSDYDVSPASVSVHGLTREFLLEHGKPRHEVMHRLFQDLLRYEPLVVAHFMKLDFHMLGVGFYRAGLENPLEVLPTFCTMLTTGRFVRSGLRTHLRLGSSTSGCFRSPWSGSTTRWWMPTPQPAAFSSCGGRATLPTPSLPPRLRSGNPRRRPNPAIGLYLPG